MKRRPRSRIILRPGVTPVALAEAVLEAAAARELSVSEMRQLAVELATDLEMSQADGVLVLEYLDAEAS